MSFWQKLFGSSSSPTTRPTALSKRQMLRDIKTFGRRDKLVRNGEGKQLFPRIGIRDSLTGEDKSREHIHDFVKKCISHPIDSDGLWQGIALLVALCLNNRQDFQRLRRGVSDTLAVSCFGCHTPLSETKLPSGLERTDIRRNATTAFKMISRGASADEMEQYLNLKEKRDVGLVNQDEMDQILGDLRAEIADDKLGLVVQILEESDLYH
jgi:hypothetical protein